MKKYLLFLFVLTFVLPVRPYDKKTLVERFTNCSCGPCASLNNAWYTNTTKNLIASGSMNHIVYNGNWPSPGECDPMHLLNQTNNNARISYYGVNAVPWVQINGVVFNTGSGAAAFTNTVNQGNTLYSPFEIAITAERFPNNVFDVRVIVTRDPADVTVFGDVRLRVALTENQVDVVGNSCCNNGETHFYNICRDMLPDAHGTVLEIPDPGNSVEYSFQYIASQDFLDKVNLDSIAVAAFIQSNNTKEIYQSFITPLVESDRLNAAFVVEETMGPVPYTVQFTDYSYSSSSIISYEWDFDFDGTIDSQEPNPEWTYNEEGVFTVSLTVNNGTETHTRILHNYITTLTAESDILIVNGIQYITYPAEMTNFYNNSACFGNHQVDIWDLFGDQGFDYLGNSSIQKVNLFNRGIPTSILNLYQKVIWIGNNFGGDLPFFDADQVIDYVTRGGNFLLATRMANFFFNQELKNYCGVSALTGDQTITQIIALDPNLVNMSSVGTNSLVHLVFLLQTSEAIPIFDNDTSNTWRAGFRLNKEDEGNFIFIAGRPYRYNNTASFANYDYIIDNWMKSIMVDAGNETPVAANSFHLLQNYPNPFNPSTSIQFAISSMQFVSLKVYDILGREVAALVNEEKQPGIYEVEFSAEGGSASGRDAYGLSSGIYFYKLRAGSFVETKKMILMK
ncbi:MAG: T9SS type A sorting domain-containing protein [Ignavibacteria bacterium]|nr:T9SS type A sorting domain-containing protein [Ignavibacteria bacterium]